MRRIAKFHKVSPAQFAKDWKDTFEQYSEEGNPKYLRQSEASEESYDRKCRI